MSGGGAALQLLVPLEHWLPILAGLELLLPTLPRRRRLRTAKL